MHRKWFRYVAVVSLITAALLAVTIFFCVRQTDARMTQYSFDALSDSTKRLADEQRVMIETDRKMLTVIGELLSEQDMSEEKTVLSLMRSFDTENSFVSDLELLLPDGHILRRDGTEANAAGKLDFAAEAEKGAYISGRTEDVFDPEKKIVRNAVPVQKDGETVAVLYGISDLQALSKAFNAEIYGVSAFVLMADGDTGDILLDTWHDTLGEISDLYDRQIEMGGSYADVDENLKNGTAGDVASVSHKLGRTVYMHYEPVGINNWSIMLCVSEDTALSGTRECVETLYVMAVLVGVILTAYAAFIIWCMVRVNHSVYRMSVTDGCTGLLNRIAYEQELDSKRGTTVLRAVCIYIDANGLHEINNQRGHAAGDSMLCAVADALRGQFNKNEVYRIGGDEFVVLPAETNTEICAQKMQNASEALEKEGYSVSYGIAAEDNAEGLNGLVRDADARMLENKKAYYAAREHRTPR